jgi:hypothetical protein
MNLCKYIQQVEPEAWVGFTNNRGLSWLRLLKPGFRHCFLLLRSNGAWIVYDPLSNQTRIDLLWAGDELLDHLSARGCRLLPARLEWEGQWRSQPWRPFSCVEAVKRALGLSAPWVLTPWQLFRHLRQAHAKKSS